MTPERTPLHEERGSPEWDAHWDDVAEEVGPRANPYAHVCREGCACDGRRALVRTNHAVDLFVWLFFGLCAVGAWWRWG